jgi:UDP-N-acetylglucosamine 1-carboxyvinyltransferase
MAKYSVVGGRRLEGELKVQGSKNAVLPILAAVLLNKGLTVLHNCPKIKDVENMLSILSIIGCSIKWDGQVLIIDSKTLNTDKIPENYVQLMRSSIILLGSVLGRLKTVEICYPGGCSIGGRPIDLHIKAIKQMNVDVSDANGFIKCQTKDINGANIHLDYPSVGATENVMLAAILSTGVTRINNAAKEPEIIELECFLNAMGGKVTGAGTDCITIEGVSELHDVEYYVMPDRIVVGTYLAAAAMTAGEINLIDARKNHIEAVCSRFAEMGCVIKSDGMNIYIRAPHKLKAINMIRTQPYPGFPTDMQSQLMACLCIARGTSVISEMIFESRYKHVPELVKMGAHIITEGRIAIVKGVSKLTSAQIFAEDLRGGAALVLAALAAEGETTIHNAHHILRGYEHIEKDLNSLGAMVRLKA